MLNIQQGAVARGTDFVCLIYGESGIGKTHFALGATNPLYLNCEKGAKRVELRNLTTVDTMNVLQFEDLLQITTEDIAPYTTLIIDTLGAVITKAQDYVMRLKKKATFTIQDWGTLRTYVVNVMEKFIDTGKNVIIIAHEEVEQSKMGKEEGKVVPMAQGSAINVIETRCDIIGHMYRDKNLNRILDICGTSAAKTKNCFKFSKDIIIPEQGEGQLNTTFKKIIEDRVTAYRAEEQRQAPIFNELLETFKAKINAISTPEHCTMILKEINETEDVLNIRARAKQLLHKRSIELGCVYDGVEQIFKKGE